MAFGTTVGEGAQSGDLRLTEAASDRLQLVYRNAKQMKKIVRAKYLGLRFDEAVIDAQSMGYECSRTVCVSISHRMRFADSA